MVSDIVDIRVVLVVAKTSGQERVRRVATPTETAITAAATTTTSSTTGNTTTTTSRPQMFGLIFELNALQTSHNLFGRGSIRRFQGTTPTGQLHELHYNLSYGGIRKMIRRTISVDCACYIQGELMRPRFVNNVIGLFCGNDFGNDNAHAKNIGRRVIIVVRMHFGGHFNSKRDELQWKRIRKY